MSKSASVLIRSTIYCVVALKEPSSSSTAMKPLQLLTMINDDSNFTDDDLKTVQPLLLFSSLTCI